MSMPKSLFLFLLPWLFFSVPLAVADVGTATIYPPPYLPTACFGNDRSQFPTSNLFAAVGEGIWDNSAACGRQYLVRCLSSATPAGCVANETIRVRVVERAEARDLPAPTMALSTAAFQKLASNSASAINIEFTPV